MSDDNLVLHHLRELRSSMDTRFSTMDTRFDAVDTRFDAIDGKLEAIGDEVHDNNIALADLATNALEVRQKLASHEREIKSLKLRLDKLGV